MSDLPSRSQADAMGLLDVHATIVRPGRWQYRWANAD